MEEDFLIDEFNLTPPEEKKKKKKKVLLKYHKQKNKQN
jgi:hypothetical protein